MQDCSLRSGTNPNFGVDGGKKDTQQMQRDHLVDVYTEPLDGTHQRPKMAPQVTAQTQPDERFSRVPFCQVLVQVLMRRNCSRDQGGGVVKDARRTQGRGSG